jgi:Family of unknown function (DUF6262)
MRADNSRHLVTAARSRAAQTRQRALIALQQLDAAGQPVSFGTVARQAGVSRSWLYTQPDLRADIQRRRGHDSPARAAHTTLPDRQRASEASLLRRLEAATDRIRRLENENRQLRGSLAVALGQQRAASLSGSSSSRDTPASTAI